MKVYHRITLLRLNQEASQITQDKSYGTDSRWLGSDSSQCIISIREMKQKKKTYLSLKLAHLPTHEKVPQTESVLENPFDKVSLKLNS